MTSINAVRPRDLDPAQLERWRQLAATGDELVSPYFHPEYTLAVAEVVDDVWVAVVGHGAGDGCQPGDGEAYLPFQRGRLGMAGPVGGGFNDYQGVIAPPGFAFDPEEVVAQLGLRLLDFDHQLASQAPFRPWTRRRSESPYLDLSEGFDAYAQARKEAGSSRIGQYRRKARKLGREVGELRLEYHETDERVLDQVIDWKRAQCRRTGGTDFFAWDWTRGIVHRLHQTKTDGFAGILTALYAGDDLVAAHFGMRTDRTLHWWFPTYDRSLGRYSPGGIMLLLLAERAAAEGITMLDLGRGEGGYKASFASAAVPLLEGSVAPPSWVSVGRDALRATESFARHAPVLEPARSAARRLRDRVRPRPTD